MLASYILNLSDGFQKDWLAVGLNPVVALPAGQVGNQELGAIITEGPIKEEVDCPVVVETSKG